MRLFVAVILDGKVKEAAVKSILELKKRAVLGNFTLEENLHLTLAFIGETTNFAAIKEAINSVSINSFTLCINGAGKFKRSNGDIYWIGIKNNPVLTELVNNLTSALRSRGFKIENRNYKPHITVGREVVLNSKFDFIIPVATMTVNRISLMKSERICGRLTYTEVYGKQI